MEEIRYYNPEKYRMGELVYLITDELQRKRMIIAIRILIDGSVLFSLSCGTTETLHFAQEISRNKTFDL